MRQSILRAATLCFLVPSGFLAAQTQVTNLFPTADAALFEQFPEHNLGRNSTLAAGTDAKGNRTRAVFRFDPSSIPSDHEVINVQFQFAVTRVPLGGGVGSTFAVYDLAEDWIEGESKGNTGTKTRSGVTWEFPAQEATPWSSPGGSFGGSGLAEIKVDEPGTYVIPSSPALIASVQSWIEQPTENKGWILISDLEDTKATARRIAAREHSENPPQLQIEHRPTLPQPIITMTMKSAIPGLEATLSIQSIQESTFAIESSSDLVNWTQRAELAMPGDPIDIQFVDSSIRQETHRFYRLKNMPEQKLAHVINVDSTGDDGDYRFSVTVKSPDTGCDQYADWWEVMTPAGDLIYRRVLLHSHVDEQPFARSGGPLPIAADEEVIIRAHMNNNGYGGIAMKGSVATGFHPIAIEKHFAQDLATVPPTPSGCQF